MPFSQAVKLQVKRKADFRCCRCHEVGIDIHHIVPEAQGGPSDIDNAAPLCQNCHDRFGANPEKRKEIRQMRDWWYEIVQEKYHEDQSRFEKLNETILEIQRTQVSNKVEVDKLREELIAEIRALRPIQEQALEDIKFVSVADIPRQANTAIAATNIRAIAGTIEVMGMPETLRHAAEQKKSSHGALPHHLRERVTNK